MIFPKYILPDIIFISFAGLSLEELQFHALPAAESRFLQLFRLNPPSQPGPTRHQIQIMLPKPSILVSIHSRHVVASATLA
jgi:hypothetical protein